MLIRYMPTGLTQQTHAGLHRHPALRALVLTAVVAAVPALAAAQSTARPQQPPPTQPTTAKPQPPPQQPPSSSRPAPSAVTKPAPPAPTPGIPTPADYVIGPDDALDVVVWRDKDMSASVQVRPDGKISLPLVNDIQAAGLTPDQLRESVKAAVARFVTDPAVTIVVRQINSRKVYVTGSVGKPGPYPLSDTMTVLQMLALAGGLSEYANGKEILVMRTERGQTQSFKFNYKDVSKGKNLQQNIVLRPGDTIVVP
jgi:polysaccharide export outer membrane protein